MVRWQSRKLIGLVAVMFAFFSLASSYRQIINNSGFEDNSLNGWTVAGDASINPRGLDKFSNNSLQKVAEGSYSGQIGDSTPWQGSGVQESSIEQIVTLPSSLDASSVLQFEYAVVANDPPDHPEVDKPRFRITVDDITSAKNLLDSQYLYTSQTSKEWYLGTGSSNPIANQPYYMLAGDRWVFRNWKQVSLPLSGLGGHELKIRFEVRDCNYGAHAVYGYLDGVRVGPPEKVNLPDLEGDPQQAKFIEPPFWSPLIGWIEKLNILWICCLLPILLLLLLLFLLLRKKKPARPVYFDTPATGNKPKPPVGPTSGTKMGN